MAASLDGSLERYRSLLRVQVRRLQLSPSWHKRFDDSDLVQETLLRAHQHRDQFRGDGEALLLKWLYEILHNVVRDEVDRATAGKRDIGREESLEALSASGESLVRHLTSAASPAETAERNETLLRVAAAVDQLPEEQRDAVLLRDLMELPVAEVAARLGKTEASVAGLLRRGHEQLRKMLSDSDD